VVNFSLRVNAFPLTSKLNDLNWDIHLYTLEGLTVTGEERFRRLSNIAENVESLTGGRTTYYAPTPEENYIVVVNPKVSHQSLLVDKMYKLVLHERTINPSKVREPLRRVFYKISRMKLLSHRMWESERNRYYRFLFTQLEDLENYRIYRGVFLRYDILEDGTVLLVLDPLTRIVTEDSLREIISREGVEKAKRRLRHRRVLIETLRKTPGGYDLRLMTSRMGLLHPDKYAGQTPVVPYKDKMVTIKEYYKRLNMPSFVKDVEDHEILFQAEGSPYYYAVSKARLIVRFEDLKKEERKKLKDIIYLKADQRIKLTYEFLLLLNDMKDPWLGKIEFEDEPFNVSYYEVLKAPKLKFGESTSEDEDLVSAPPLESNKAYREFFRDKLRLGPARRISIPRGNRIVIVYPNDLSEKHVRNFYLKTLRKECLQIFHVSLPRDLYCWQYANIGDLEKIRTNYESYKNRIAGILGILRNKQEELYVELKKLFRDTPNQMLTLRLLTLPFVNPKRMDIYTNALRNLISGFLGKMGFRPWLLAERLNADLYIGIDTMPSKAVVGVAVNPLGDYLLEEIRMLKGRLIPRDTIRRFVRDLVYRAARLSRLADNRKLLVVIHRDGDLYPEELDGILESKEGLLRRGIQVKYVIVSVKKTTPYRIYDLDESLGKYEACRMGSYVKLDSHHALLASTGLPLLSQGMARPLLVELCHSDDEKYGIDVASQEIYRLSYMHWATITQKIKLPATIKFADDFAYMISEGIEEIPTGPPL